MFCNTFVLKSIPTFVPHNPKRLFSMYPFKFEPLLKQTIWGGDKINSYKNLTNDLTQIGESWELSGVPGHESIVSNGELKGTPLHRLIERFGAQVVGNDNYSRFGITFPLLIKFIDARQDLSIQVHPNDELAQKRHGCPGKNEMWYVISADPHARLCAGLSHTIDAPEYERRVKDGTIEEVLCFHELHAGDVFNIPAGRVHSIGAGAFIAEIQQTSDITYRIYDFNRRDAKGCLRELHTELAKDAIDYTALPDYRTHYTPSVNTPVELVASPHFTTSVYDLTEEMTCDYSELDTFIIYICTKGSAILVDDQGNETAIRQGETVLIPACTSTVSIRPEGNVTLLETWV